MTEESFDLVSASGSGGVTMVPAAVYTPARITVRPAKGKGTWAPGKSSRKELITKTFKPSSAHYARCRCHNAISQANKIILLLFPIIFLYGTSPLCHLRDTQHENSHTGAPSFLQTRMLMPVFVRSIACELLWIAYRISWKIATGSL